MTIGCTLAWVGNQRIKDIEIRWPSGIRQVLHNVAADQILTIEEPQH